MSVEQPPLPNREQERLNYSPLVGLQGRLVTEQFDPAADVGLVDGLAVKALPERDTSIYKRASLAERAGNEQTVNAWATSTAEKIKPFFASEAGRNYQRILQKAGISLTQCTGDELTVVYNKYFGLTGKESNVAGFVQDILTPYIRQDRIDYETLKKDLKVFRWFAQIFGANSSEIIAQLADAEAQLILNKAEFVNKVNEQQNGKSRVDRLNEEEKRLLTFLNQFSERKDAVTTGRTDPTDPPITEEDDTTEDDDETGEQLPLPDTEQEYRLEELFGQVVGPVNKNTDYFVGNPPATLTLTAEDLKKYQSNKAFFSTYDPITGIFNPNPEVVPYTFDLGEDVRFQNAEALTDGDSGLLAVSAVASGKGRDAESAKKQALVYRHLGNSVLRIHRANQDLLKEWLRAQTVDLGGGKTSLGQLASYDRNMGMQLRPEKERLFHYDQDGGLTVTTNTVPFEQMWQARITELETALRTNKLKKHHLRWLEFLSHSTDVKGLLDLMREQGETDPKKKQAGKETLEEARIQFGSVPEDQRYEHLAKANSEGARQFTENLRAEIRANRNDRLSQRDGVIYHKDYPYLGMHEESGRIAASISTLADRYDLSICLATLPGEANNGHAMLLLTGPIIATSQDPDEYRDQLVIRCYDPLSRGVKTIPVRRNLTYDQYIEEGLRSGVIKKEGNRFKINRGGSISRRVGFGAVEMTPQELYLDYIRETTGLILNTSRRAEQELYDRNYNLEQKDTSVPDFVASAKFTQMQTDTSSCAAVSFFAGVLHNALRDEPGMKERMERFYSDFGVPILTLEDIREVKKKEVFEKIQLDLDSLRETNLVASVQFMQILRDNAQPIANSRDRETIGGLHIGPDDWFFCASGLETQRARESKKSTSVNHLAAARYSLPIAIRVDGGHARLITKGPYKVAGRWFVNEWNPFHEGTQQIELSSQYEGIDDVEIARRLNAEGISTNSLFVRQLREDPEENNLEALILGIDMADVRRALYYAKFNSLQTNTTDCIPLTMFVAGMLNALKPGETPFKTEGLAQFSKDFFVGFRTREEILTNERERARKQAEDFEVNLSISVLEPDATDVPAIVEQDTETATIIKTDDLPKKDAFPQIDLTKTTADILGFAELFEQEIKVDDNTRISPLVKLEGLSSIEGDFCYFNVVQNGPEGELCSSALVFVDTEHSIHPVGHVDYTIPVDNRTRAACCMSVLNQIVNRSGSARGNELISSVLGEFCPGGSSSYAVKVADKFKGRGLGKVLWYLALAYAETQGVEDIKIIGDMTKGQKGPGESFYRHLGATPVLYIGKSINLTTGETGLAGGEYLVLPTFLVGKQLEALQEATGGLNARKTS